MKVTLWKSADGTLHEDYQNYLRHEAKSKVLKAAEGVLFEGDAFQEDDAGNTVVYMDDLPLFIASNFEKIKSIIEGATVVRRGRKVKEAA